MRAAFAALTTFATFTALATVAVVATLAAVVALADFIAFAAVVVAAVFAAVFRPIVVGLLVRAVGAVFAFGEAEVVTLRVFAIGNRFSDGSIVGRN